jgi:hypothetical protein
MGLCKAVDVSGNGGFSIGASKERGAPDQCSFQRLDPKGGEVNNVSTMALSKQLPLPDIEMVTPAARNSAW